MGLDFPAALAIALGRHLYLKNTGWFSLNIYVPNVTTTRTLLDGVNVEEKGYYTCSELVHATRENGNGVFGVVDAVGLWSLAADVKSGKLRGEDVRGFQEGTLFERLERRRKGTGQILPLWRGGPISAAGHSWVVKKVFGVDVYQDEGKRIE